MEDEYVSDKNGHNLNIFAKFTAESDIKRDEAEKFMKEALQNIATGVQVSFVNIGESVVEEEELGGG